MNPMTGFAAPSQTSVVPSASPEKLRCSSNRRPIASLSRGKTQSGRPRWSGRFAGPLVFRRTPMAVSSLARLLITAELEGPKPNGGVPASPPWLAVRKPSWVVRTESNVRKEKKKKPDPPCVVCHGSGRVDCHRCYGKGRTNHVHLTMLPKGEWPKWCKTCGGSGLGYCDRCLGSGEYRYIMGFKFMYRDADHNNHPPHREPGKQASSDWLLDQDEKDSGS